MVENNYNISKLINHDVCLYKESKRRFKTNLTLS